jgi:hypothetical protein
MGSININNMGYVGKSIIVTKNKIIIDGVDVTPDAKIVNITVTGDVEAVSADICEKITVTGNVKTISTTNGDVKCGNVEGNVSLTNGDIECGDVKGDVHNMSGDIKCGTVGGNVKTMSGDIKHK